MYGIYIIEIELNSNIFNLAIIYYILNYLFFNKLIFQGEKGIGKTKLLQKVQQKVGYKNCLYLDLDIFQDYH